MHFINTVTNEGIAILPAGVVIARPIELLLHPMELGKHERMFIAYFVAGSSPTNSHRSGDADLASVQFFSMQPPSIITSNLSIALFPVGAWKDTRKLAVVTWSIPRLLGAEGKSNKVKLK